MTNGLKRVLLVDDDAAVREALGQTLELADLHPVTMASFVAAKDMITPGFDGIILSDIRMPGRDGFHLLSYAQEVDADLPVILLTGEGDIPMAVRAMGQGAFGFLEKPCVSADMLPVIERALKTRAMVLENRALKMQLETGDPAARMLFGSSELAENLRGTVRNMARVASEILICGAPGSGISKVAEVVHLCSPRSKGPFGKYPAAQMSPEALQDIFANAADGSLFLDEISAMPMQTQFALLDALDSHPSVSVLLGSTKPLVQLVTQGGMNADLYYRFEGMQLRIPSLAERPEDIPVLFQHYVAQASEQAGIATPDVPSDMLAALMAQDWPGNARSLMSAAMRFVLGMPGEMDAGGGLGLSEQMAQVERSLLIAALGRHNGRASEAAKALKLPRKTFYDKLARYGIKPEAYRR